MPQLQILTSSSDMIPIPDFKYICELAKCSKCTVFVVLKNTNMLYGFDGDCCCIHEISIPFPINTDLVFRLDMIDKNVLNDNDNFFIPEEFNWVIIPEYYWTMYSNGDLEAVYDSGLYMILDKTTKQPIEQFHMYKMISNDDYMYKTVMDQLAGFFNRKRTLCCPTYFCNVQDNPVIRKIYDSKAIMGRSLVHLKNDAVDIAFYMYKGLFTLNKSDTLDIEIRFDLFEKNTFMASFKPKKKKNPMFRNNYGVPFEETIHCMFINIAM